MPWVVTPPTQTPGSPPGWVTTPGHKPPPEPVPGWVAIQIGEQFILARPSGSGTFSVVVVHRAIRDAALTGDGALAAATSLPREIRSADLAGNGTLSIAYTLLQRSSPQFNSLGTLFSGTVTETMYPRFCGEGGLAGYWDGLTAVVAATTGVAAAFSSEGTLWAFDYEVHGTYAPYLGTGALAGLLVPKLLALLAGNGALSAVASSAVSPALSGAGTLTAAALTTYLRSAGFSGAGALAALILQLLTPTPGGTGTIAAQVKQIYSVSAALSGGGTLLALAGSEMRPPFAGVGSLSATDFAIYARLAGLLGGGILSATNIGVHPRASGLTGAGSLEALFQLLTRPGFSGTGAMSAAVSQLYALLSQLSGNGALTALVVAGGVTAPIFAGSGVLVATDFARYAQLALLSGAGSLSATDYARYLRPVGLSGTGSLAAQLQPQLSVPVALGGSGALSATVSPRYISDVESSGDGELSAEFRMFGAPAWPDFFGDGALAAAMDAGHHYFDTFNRLNQPRGGVLAGAGVLSAAALRREFRTSSLTGGGTLSATVSGTLNKLHLEDLFDRADSATGLGASWTARRNVVGIQSNQAYPVTGSNHCIVTHVTAMPADDMSVSFVLGAESPSATTFGSVLGANTAGQGAGAFASYLTNEIFIYTFTSWTSSFTNRGTLSAVMAIGDTITLRRVGNLYTAQRNGVAAGTWTDSGNVVPRDSSHRLVGLWLLNNFSTYQRADSWWADEL